jgi:hypothetical protein
MFGQNLSKAIVQAQSEMTNAVKDSKNPFFKSKYADLNAVREAVLPALSKYKVAVLQPVVLLDNGKSVVRTTILHETGESYTADTEVVCAKASDPQAYGSAISYARRYALQALFNVGAVDDDAEGSMGRTQPQQTKSATTETKVEATSVEAKQESKEEKAPASRSFQNRRPKPQVTQASEDVF